MGMGLLSCDFGNVGNSQTFQNTPAVVCWKMDMGGTALGTPFGYLAAPSILDVYEGDCIFISQFTIDYDNQPSDNYYTISNVLKEKVDEARFIERNSIELDDYTLPISNVGGMVDEFFIGRFFAWISCKDKNPSLRLLYNPTEEETDGVKNFYLQAKPSSSTESASEVSTIQVFNLLNFVQQNGSDTTKTFKNFEEKFDFKFVKANLKYVSKITDGEPEYKSLNSSDKPIEIYVFKNQ